MNDPLARMLLETVKIAFDKSSPEEQQELIRDSLKELKAGIAAKDRGAIMANAEVLTMILPKKTVVASYFEQSEAFLASICKHTNTDPESL